MRCVEQRFGQSCEFWRISSKLTWRVPQGCQLSRRSVRCGVTQSVFRRNYFFWTLSYIIINLISAWRVRYRYNKFTRHVEHWIDREVYSLLDVPCELLRVNLFTVINYIIPVLFTYILLREERVKSISILHYDTMVLVYIFWWKIRNNFK